MREVNEFKSQGAALTLLMKGAVSLWWMKGAILLRLLMKGAALWMLGRRSSDSMEALMERNLSLKHPGPLLKEVSADCLRNSSRN